MAVDRSEVDGGGGGGIGAKVGPLPVWAWFLVAAGVFGVFLLVRRRSAATAGTGPTRAITGSTGVTAVDPLTGNELLTALQDLTTTLKNMPPTGTGPGATPPSPLAPPPPIPGLEPGSDVGWYHGGLPSVIPSGYHVEWRWSQWFIDANRDRFPWLSADPATFPGWDFFKNIPGMGAAPAYSWEYRVVPNEGFLTPGGQPPALTAPTSGAGNAISGLVGPVILPYTAGPGGIRAPGG